VIDPTFEGEISSGMAISGQSQIGREGHVTSGLEISKSTSWASFSFSDDGRLLFVECKQVKPFA
jgi:hypothetical protein